MFKVLYRQFLKKLLNNENLAIENVKIRVHFKSNLKIA